MHLSSSGEVGVSCSANSSPRCAVSCFCIRVMCSTILKPNRAYVPALLEMMRSTIT